MDPDQTAPFRSSLIWVHTVCKEQSDLGPHCLPVCKNRFEKFARIFSRRHKQTTFSDAGFFGALRVNVVFMERKVVNEGQFTDVPCHHEKNPTPAELKPRTLWSDIGRNNYSATHTCHISHCEIKSHRIWPIWKQVPVRFFKSHRMFRPISYIFSYKPLLTKK